MKGIDDDEVWYCLRSKTKREHIAAAFVSEQCRAEVFAPRIPVWRKTRHGRKVFVEALFPGYFFARFDWGESGRRILSTQGVTGVVRFGPNVPEVPGSVVESLMEAVREVLSSDGHDEGLEEGDIVEILSGCFKGTVARIQAVSQATDRVSVLIEFLGRSLKVNVTRSAVVACEEDRVSVPGPVLRSRQN
jgi:transcriptional antiterminator RfaH